jgi:hypothetical protein
MASGSAVEIAPHSGSPGTTQPRLAADTAARAGADDTVGLVPAAPDPPRKLRAMPLFDGTAPLQDIPLPGGAGAFGIPELVLAAYRNAELALHSSDPGCGLSWHLLAGIGKVESNHAAGGRTDANGTTVGVIYGPALDGTLPGNAILKAADGSYVRAVGPMQFLPGTWAKYASDGRGSGHPDPNNVFDAALAAGRYLCSGGLDLRDPQQELRAVLRYNESVAYAAQVLSWSNAYQSGGAPMRVSISPDLIPPGTMPDGAGATEAGATAPATTTQPPVTQPPVPAVPQAPTQVMINIPGLPPIPCGIFCPPPQPNPCDPATVPGPLPKPGDTVTQEQRWAPGLVVTQANPVEPVKPGDPMPPAGGPEIEPNALQAPNPQQPNAQQPHLPASCVQPQAQAPQLPGLPTGLLPSLPNAQQPPAPAPVQPQPPAKTPGPGPVPPAAPTPAAPPPAIRLPFNIVIPLPPGPAPATPRQR